MQATEEDLSPAERLLRAAYDDSLKMKVRLRPAAPAAVSSAAHHPPVAAPPGPKKLRVIGTVASSQPSSVAAATAAPATSDKPSETRAESALDPAGFLLESDWVSVEQDAPLVIPLQSLAIEGAHGNNSLVLALTMPVNSKRFSLNICPFAPQPGGSGASVPTIFYHFNPRGAYKKGDGRVIPETIVQDSFANNAWQADKDKSLRGFPITFGQRFTLRLTVVKEGFEVYIDGQLKAGYRHRVGLPTSPSFLVVPNREDSYDRERENVVVHSVWWGHLEPANAMAPLAAPLQSVNEYDPNTIFVAGLRKGELTFEDAKRIFTHYQMFVLPDGAPAITANADKGTALVRLKFDRNVSEAIAHLHNKYDLECESTLVVQRSKHRA